MDVLRNLFNRFSRKDSIYFTEVTVLKPGVFNKSNDFVEFTDMRCRQMNPHLKKSTTLPSFRDYMYRVSPTEELLTKTPVYTQEDLYRIAEMFLVSYTHSSNEENLPNYKKKMSQENVKTGRNVFKQIRIPIS